MRQHVFPVFDFILILIAIGEKNDGNDDDDYDGDDDDGDSEDDDSCHSEDDN